MSNPIPPAEVDIDINLVHGLITNQFPRLKDLDISFLDSGWDNENYRLGNKYIIRLPRRAAAIPLLENEISWLPKLKDKLPIDIPAPIFVGKPSEAYPWPWTIIPWRDGRNGCIASANPDEIFRLVDFLKVLHAQPAKDAPYNDHRCLPLSDKSKEVVNRINKLTALNDAGWSRLWNNACKEEVPKTKYLLHGDIHPRNVIIHQGSIQAIIDWGDMTAGDVATDLASLWMLFDDPKIRERGFDKYGADKSLRLRVAGWALFYGTLFLDLGDQSEGEYLKAGKRILRNLKDYYQLK